MAAAFSSDRRYLSAQLGRSISIQQALPPYHSWRMSWILPEVDSSNGSKNPAPLNFGHAVARWLRMVSLCAKLRYRKWLQTESAVRAK
jgi:hypothetical protein